MKPISCFFEDHFLENFHPLTLTRPLFDLRVGILTLGEKWLYALGDSNLETQGVLREHQKDVFRQVTITDPDQTVLWINPRFVPSSELTDRVKNLSELEGLFYDSQLIAAVLTNEIHQKWVDSGIHPTDVKEYRFDLQSGPILKNSWELFQLNGDEIRSDLKLLGLKPIQKTDSYPNALLVNREQIFIEEGAVIEPGSLLFAEKGPVYIGKNAHIMANSVVRGPSAICERSVVKMGAKIYEDTTIGPVCKVGGEISNVIFHSYSNKSHDGYAGNSVFGQWCNLGADTNTSNLKNNYSTVKVVEWKTNKEYDTGQQFIGTIMGDHSKTGINSMLNTGTICGVCCNLFSDDYPPKFVPSFSWVSGNNIVPYHFEKAIEAMEKMMQRRAVILTPA
ncbi:MAG: putative sugar nucleotidyl transferase, partial [Balneolaceae bacterium]